jgi:hypothetical protein
MFLAYGVNTAGTWYTGRYDNGQYTVLVSKDYLDKNCIAVDLSRICGGLSFYYEWSLTEGN